MPRVREHALFYDPQTDFAATYAQAAKDCGATVLTEVNGAPSTLQIRKGADIEILLISRKSVISVSSNDPSVTPRELNRIAEIADQKAGKIKFPS